MKTIKMVVAFGVAAMLSTSGLAWSKDRVFHEAQWDQVKSYNDVPVSKDSLDSYGFWNEAPKPAAGGGAVAGLIGVPQEAGYTPQVATVAAPAPVVAVLTPAPVPAPAPVPPRVGPGPVGFVLPGGLPGKPGRP